MNHKKVLVISNNCFSQTNSNGRTLGNLFVGWPKEDLAQFCVSSQNPDWSICENYYCLGDKAMLRAFLTCKKAVGEKIEQQALTESFESVRGKSWKKTLYKVVARELVWACNRWRSKSLEKWVDDFNPDEIILQFGDSIFMLDIALSLSKTRKIPLVVYNTEGYYFFSRNWYHSVFGDVFLFKLYVRIYRKKVKKLMQQVKYCIYLNDKLKEDYDKAFNIPSRVIYNSSSVLKSDIPLFSKEKPTISYLGNLGLDRDTALMEVGKVLHEINPVYSIDVYGPANEEMKKRLTSAEGVRYRGNISYDDVKGIIASSDILLHVETERGHRNHQLDYAFSTKIADSLASGRCFVVYAPSELVCSEYVKKNQCGWVAANQVELKQALYSIIYDRNARTRIRERAVEVATQNHDIVINAAAFQYILLHL